MIDFQDSQFLQNPYPTLNRVRESTAMFRVPGRNGSPDVSFITRHDDIVRTMRDRRLGRTFEHVMSNEEVGVQAPPSDRKPFSDLEQWSLLQLEPPEHTRIRGLLAQEFTPERIAALEPSIRNTIDVLLDASDHDNFDLLTDLAQPLSVSVMCELLGAPYADKQLLLDWSHAIVTMYELDTSDEQVKAAVDASENFSEWALDLISQRRTRPRSDLISGLCATELGGERLSDSEIVSTIVLLLNAGHEATVNTLGNGLTALLRHPVEIAKLRDGSVSWTSAVEELFRYDSPLQLFERWVLADEYDVAGETLPRGSKVAMLLGSANRDPRKWDRPDTFDVSRSDRTHVSFGFGVHHCIGAGLARLEVSTVVQQLLTRFPNTELTSNPVRKPAFVIHGYERVALSLS